MIDELDKQLAAADPRNSLRLRSIRVLDHEIADLEAHLDRLRFVRDTLILETSDEGKT